jgi:hypothetical protein
MAPEVAREEAIDLYEAIDVYGVGQIALHMAGNAATSNAGSPVRGDSELQNVLVARERAGFAVTIPADVPAPFAQLIWDCVQVVPAARPTIAIVASKLQTMGKMQKMGTPTSSTDVTGNLDLV